MSKLSYEPRVILEHADRLNRRADSMGVTSAIIGALIGGFFGAVPLTTLGEHWPIPHQFGFGTLLGGLLIGALTGYVIGDARSFGYRLQAQSSLCQLNLERNTAALLADTYPVAAAPAPPAAPVVASVEPEPVAYVEPEPEPYVYVEPEPVAEYIAPEPAPIVEPYIEPVPDPEPEPEPAALTVVPSFEHSEPEPEPVEEPADAPLPDLDSMSLEQIARLANTGQLI